MEPERDEEKPLLEFKGIFPNGEIKYYPDVNLTTGPSERDEWNDPRWLIIIIIAGVLAILWTWLVAFFL